MVTIKEVATLAGVSVSTVSYALNNDTRISEDTRKKVFDAAKQLNYTKSAGKTTLEAASKNIVMNLHTIGGTVFSELVASAKKIFTDNGYRFYVQLNDYASCENWIHGYIILNSQISNANIKELSRRKLNIITLDRVLSLPNLKSIVTDNFDAMYKITEKTIQKGCKKFFYLGGVAGSYDSKCRYEGFLAALSKHGISFNDNVQLMNGDFTFESGKTAAKYFIGTNKPSDAFICANDEMAVGVIHVLKKANLKKQIIVTGFGGVYTKISDSTYDFAKYSFLSAMVDYKKIGSFAAYSLIEMLERRDCTPENNIITIPSNLIEHK